MKKLLIAMLLLFPLLLISGCEDSGGGNSGGQGGTEQEPPSPDDDNTGGGNPKYEPKLFTNPSSHTGFYIDENADLYITGRHFYEEPERKHYNFFDNYSFYTNNIYETFIKINEVKNVKKAIGTPHYILILTNDGELYSWGYDYDEYGFLGQGNNYKISIPTKIQFPNNEKIKDISAFSSDETIQMRYYGFSLALTEDNKIYGWGYNGSGQLGQEKNIIDNNTKTPVLMENRGEIPDDVIIEKIASGDDFTLALGNDGNIYGWGKNNNGSNGCWLGFQDEHTTGQVLYTCRKIDSIYLPTKLLLSDIIDIEVGIDRSIAIDKNGYLWTFGNNVSDYIGYNIPTIKERQHIPSKIDVDNNGNVFPQNNIKLLRLGDDVSSVITEDNKVYGWGNKELYMLGLTETNKNKLPTKISEPLWINEEIKDIYFGNGFTYLTTSDGKYYSFGRFGWTKKNDNNEDYVEYGGQLGIGKIDEEEYGLTYYTLEMQKIIINKGGDYEKIK